MSRKHQVIEEGSFAPAYLVTFSALVTLLMLFFVLLLTLATVQDDGILDKGRYAKVQESFLLSLRTLGLGTYYSKKSKPDFGYIKPKYYIEEPDKQFEGRTITAKEERIRNTFKNISQFAKTMPSQMVAKRINFLVTNISFSHGKAGLNNAAKKFLTQFAVNLQQDSRSQAIKLCVLGLAGDESTEKKQWILSARRAKAVADFLNDTLPSQFQCPVYSWGAGPGGYWITGDSPVSKQSQILIAVLMTDD